jgi:hypothetical protein
LVKSNSLTSRKVYNRCIVDSQAKQMGRLTILSWTIKNNIAQLVFDSF